MSLGDRLGVAGLIVAFIAIGTTYLWPDKKWIGWLSLFFAAALLLAWAVIEIRQKYGPGQIPFVISLLTGAATGAGIAALIWFSVPLGQIRTPLSEGGRWPPVELVRVQAPDGLAVLVRNNSNEAVPYCAAYLHYLGRVTAKPGGVEKHAGTFSGMTLIKAHRLPPRQESEKGYIARVPHAAKSYFTLADASTGAPQTLKQAGTYLAEINILTSPDGKNHSPNQLLFDWSPGTMPIFRDVPYVQ